ncbi:AraC family transcriptional regulator [Mangrovibacterium diazotrophicum]|uniref:AraC-like DNA-binding protein n=1 Tax=Mangrovibacterium diazotrophicum TaxID=1261403 RepID=A0A419W5W3_9BACT|nr:AraC family transcriptional regulator [Mangrovibacterium diazotrophicum]RKD90835.1 AraC-like DNA-binding protein [Mangrovibacterium diazotrophicum]
MDIDKDVKYCHVSFNDGKSFYFDHVRISWDEQIGFHRSDTWELSYVITGSGTRLIGDTLEVFSRGEVILIPPDLPHGWFFDQFDHDETGKIENITIIFPTNLLERCALAFPEISEMVRKLQQIDRGLSFEGDTLSNVQQLMTLMTRQNDIEQLGSLLSIFQLIGAEDQPRVVGLMDKNTKSKQKLHEVTRYMVHNYHRSISLDDVASFVGMNRSSFCSFYKRAKGRSFFTDLTEYRIDCSCLMLRQTDITVADICFAVGFNDIPHFNRTFKRFKGESPKNYRLRMSPSVT